MPREIVFTEIHIHANATPCFHHCRYCQLRTSKPAPAGFSRYAALVNRFIDWKIASGRKEFGICPWYGNSHDVDLEIQKGIRRLSERQNGSFNVVLLGGVRHRSAADMRIWLEERRKIGIDTVAAAFTGYGEYHDYWNNRKENYRFFLDTLRTAADMGMHLQQRILLTRRSMGSLERLFDDLDAIGAPSFDRWSIPLFYVGQARELEDERLSEQEYAALSPRIAHTLREDHPNWRSERRWMEYAITGGGHEPERIALSFPVSDQSLDWAENRSCDEILAELEARWRAAYAAAPSRQELCERYGDPHSDKVYMNIGHMERLWMDRYLAENMCNFDIGSTHFR